MLDWTLFISAFVSATLLPGGSEALLALRVAEGGDALGLALTATAGNLLGSLLTFGIGRAGNSLVHHRWLGASERALARAEAWFTRWGRPSLLFAWLPVVGDPLCLLAGLLKVRLFEFVLLVGIGKLVRYALVAGLFLP